MIRGSQVAASPMPGANQVSVWAVKLSTGKVLYRQQPPARPDEGQQWSTGSEDGRLAVEQIWSTKVLGCGAIQVLTLPAGTPVRGTDSLSCPSALALSADGTQFLVRDINAQDTQTTLELVSAADGAVIRSVALPGNYVADAVAAPTGSDYMLLVDGYLVVVDGQGGISQLHPSGIHLWTGPTSSASAFILAGTDPGNGSQP